MATVPDTKKLIVIIPLAVYSVVLLSFALYTLTDIWPGNPAQLTNSTTQTRWLNYSFSISDESKVLLIVVLVGAIGSFVHTLTSLATYVGNKQFARSWTLWYLVHPFVGSGLALVLYFALRGGLINPGSTVQDVNLFGIAAISGLAGMFSREATDKLRDVFAEIFKSKANDERKDKLVPTSS